MEKSPRGAPCSPDTLDAKPSTAHVPSKSAGTEPSPETSATTVTTPREPAQPRPPGVSGPAPAPRLRLQGVPDSVQPSVCSTGPTTGRPRTWGGAHLESGCPGPRRKGYGGRWVSLESPSLRDQTTPANPRKTAFPGDSGKGGPCSTPHPGRPCLLLMGTCSELRPCGPSPSAARHVASWH